MSLDVLRFTKVSLAAAAILVAAVGCSESRPDVTEQATGSTREWVTDPTAVSEVDAASGTIVTPLDRYALTDAEYALIDSASSLAVYHCAAAQGVEGGTWTEIPSRGVGDRRYGVWDRALVERYGYDLPDRPTVVGNNTVVSALETYEACGEDPDVAQFNLSKIKPAFDVGSEVDGLVDAVLRSPEAEAVFNEWGACLEQNGLTRDLDHESGTPWVVLGADTNRSEESIRMAIIDVDCKTEVDYIQRLANIQAQYEQPIVDKYANELETVRREYDELLALAQAYTGTNAP